MSEWSDTQYYTWRDMVDINGNPLPDPATVIVPPVIVPVDTVTDEFLRDTLDAKLTDHNNEPILVR